MTMFKKLEVNGFINISPNSYPPTYLVITKIDDPILYVTLTHMNGPQIDYTKVKTTCGKAYAIDAVELFIENGDWKYFEPIYYVPIEILENALLAINTPKIEDAAELIASANSFTGEKPCTCELRALMMNGCRCGGK